MKGTTDPKIHVAFRFHVNFYHSYRGDSLDERGIGKDIRIIGGILDDLDRLNAEGIPVRGTWDIENYFSLERMMRDSAPELIERIRRRAEPDDPSRSADEIEPMSYNNGIVSACTREEFALQMRLLRSNAERSGLDDIFTRWAPVVRPQECMYTPSFLELYPEHGITAISLFYSAVPFNAFSTFVAPLAPEHRYNPLTLRSRSTTGSMTLIPCYNHGDIADNYLSLRAWLKRIRRRQLSAKSPCDMLVVIDLDADDDFWVGIDVPGIGWLLPSFAGLYRLVRSVASLEFVEFSCPGEYLQTHPPTYDLYLEHDTADGSFDGYASWAEKWENTALWGVIQKSRDVCDYARYLGSRSGSLDDSIEDELIAATRMRLLAMSTTHFGLASPVMNVGRLGDGMRYAEVALTSARAVLDRVRANDASASDAPTQTFVFPKHLETVAVSGFIPRPVEDEPEALDDETRFVYVHLGAGRREAVPGVPPPDSAASDDPEAAAAAAVLLPRVTYLGRAFRGVPGVELDTTLTGGGLARTVTGELSVIGETKPGGWSRVVTVLPGAGAVFVDLELQYPATRDFRWRKARAANLGRTWDRRWKEVMPAEILPSFTASRSDPFRVFKHNFFGDVSSYQIDYHRYSRNRHVPSINNHITNGWVAVGNGRRGILVAQHTGHDNSFAFCPMRTFLDGETQRVFLNPFGTYYGRQLRYPTAVTGIGRAAAILAADQLDSYAPSYNGKSVRFSIAIFPFDGEEPPEDVRNRALLFSSAPIVCDAQNYRPK